ncbi:MAG TPA: D-alanine--D-alanine ligase [Candidatus Sulfotelmatobacter sp.]|nr:D-alanine--D-alanine ligase [Candidatus Sulfotelmatobacter sp.]
MNKVVVLAGGISDEREISLLSGRYVAWALSSAGFQVSLIDPGEDIANFIYELKSAVAVFIMLHGKYGEDGRVQKFLEDSHIPFVGSNSKASEICFDKFQYYQLLNEHGINQPQTSMVNKEEYLAFSRIGRPYVLKPNSGGSSIDIFIVRDPARADVAQIEKAFAKYDTMLAQELIVGDELTVGIVGQNALTPVEIIPPKGKDFDYENKYNGATQELCPPKNIPKEKQTEAQRLAEKIHNLCGCQDISRTDFILDTSGKLYVLETNTLPGMTEKSLLPLEAQVDGLTMPNLCKTLVDLALKKTV